MRGPGNECRPAVDTLAAFALDAVLTRPCAAASPRRDRSPGRRGAGGRLGRARRQGMPRHRPLAGDLRPIRVVAGRGPSGTWERPGRRGAGPGGTRARRLAVARPAAALHARGRGGRAPSTGASLERGRQPRDTRRRRRTHAAMPTQVAAGLGYWEICAAIRGNRPRQRRAPRRHGRPPRPGRTPASTSRRPSARWSATRRPYVGLAPPRRHRGMAQARDRVPSHRRAVVLGSAPGLG